MNHLAAIHVIRTQLKLTDDDYRYQLKVATTSSALPAGKDSCKAMTATELAKARAHFDRMALASGVVAKPKAAGAATYTAKRAAGKRSSDDAQDVRWGKARALWAALAVAGAVQADTDAALLAYVKRQTKLDAWRFLNGYQINTVLESLKRWLARVQATGVGAGAGAAANASMAAQV